MEKVIIKKHDYEYFIFFNGGFAFAFDSDIFSLGQMISFSQKRYGKDCIIEFGAGIVAPVCKKCGSLDVEIKEFVSQLSGRGDSLFEDDDTWCNDCKNHRGIEFKNVEGKIL